MLALAPLAPPELTALSTEEENNLGLDGFVGMREAGPTRRRALPQAQTVFQGGGANGGRRGAAVRVEDWNPWGVPAMPCVDTRAVRAFMGRGAQPWMALELQKTRGLWI